MSTWDDELVELVDEDAQRVAVEWAQLHELPPLGDPAAEVERVQSVAAATLALHLSRRSGGDDVIVPDELEREVLDACQGPLSSAHRRPVFLPAGGHQNCPLVASWFARLGGGAGHRDGISSVA